MLWPEKLFVTSLMRTIGMSFISSGASVLVNNTSTIASIGGRGKAEFFSL